ncbi:MAG: energy-coupling factor transporter transmembrane protein EcfT, partial [Sphaerochaetaceae bacterium]|nr:energy-coupling factor transporter transmembrane protein EcfT [Sphaerochaetaceae bacterium]
MTNLFNYIDRQSAIHKLTGASKLAALILWSFAAMGTFDTRLLALYALLAVLLLPLSKIKISDVKFLFWFSFVFMILNNLLIF